IAQYSVHMPGNERRGWKRILDPMMPTMDHHMIVASHSLLQDISADLGIEGGKAVGGPPGDDMRAPGPQRPCGSVRLVSDLLHHRHHTCAKRIRNPFALMTQHTRNGGGRNAGTPGNIISCGTCHVRLQNVLVYIVSMPHDYVKGN